MKSLGDDSLPIDVTRDERIDSNRMVSSTDSNIMPSHHIEDTISPEHVTQNYVEYLKKYTPDNVNISTHPINVGFLVSFLVDARGGAMRGCRHSGVRVIVPPRCAPSPTRITCRYVRPQRTPHPPPLMEGEALASRVLELGPVGAKFLGPVIIEVPHFAALRGKEREIVILRSDNGESWKEHTVEATEELLNEVLHDSFEAEDLNQLEDMSSGRITRILTQDFPQYFAVVSRVRQEVHVIGPEGGMVSSTVVPQVQALFPEGALTKKIKVGLQAQPIDPELTAKLLGHGVAVSPVVTVEPRRRKFHKAITLSMPAPRAHSQGMINQYSGSAPTLRLLCSITGGTTRAQWEDVTGSTPLTFVNDCVSFTTTVSARFWLMDCRNIGDATKMATELYKEAIHVPFMAKFVVFAKRVDPLEARLRVFCMTDDKEDKTLEHQEHFTEIAKSRDVEVLEGKLQFVEFAGNLVPITKSGEQLSFSFRAFKENRLPFSVRVKDQHAEAVSRCLFMRDPKVPKGEPPQQPICILNIVLPDDIVTDTISLTDSDSVKRVPFLSEKFDYYRTDPRLTDMSNLLGDDWVLLANQLGLTSSEINVIKSEYPDSVSKQAQSMLRMWLSQSGNKPQTNTLENGLRRIGREDIIPQCLNFADTDPIKRIKHEEAETYRLKKDTDRTKKDASNDDEAARNKVPDSIGVKKHFSNYDKYSAEEKVVEKSDEEEEEAFDKPVSERREKIEKRLSIERKIPASSQRREIVQEITTIKQQSLVEDKIAEVQQKVQEQEKSTDEPVKTATTDVTVTPGTKTVSKVIQVKDKTSFNDISSIDTKEVKATLAEKAHTIHPVETTHKPTEDTVLLEGVTQSFERAKHIVPQLVADNDNDPKSPKLSKTPPPSPADFLIKERAAAIQEWQAERQPFDMESRTSQLDQDAAQKGKLKTTYTAPHSTDVEESLSTGVLNLQYIDPISSIEPTNLLTASKSPEEPRFATFAQTKNFTYSNIAYLATEENSKKSTGDKAELRKEKLKPDNLSGNTTGDLKSQYPLETACSDNISIETSLSVNSTQLRPILPKNICGRKNEPLISENNLNLKSFIQSDDPNEKSDEQNGAESVDLRRTKFEELPKNIRKATRQFLNEEMVNYDDAPLEKKVPEIIDNQKFLQIEENLKSAPDIADKKIIFPRNSNQAFLRHEVENYQDIRPVTHVLDKQRPDISIESSDSFENISTKFDDIDYEDIPIEDLDDAIMIMEENERFLRDEMSKYGSLELDEKDGPFKNASAKPNFDDTVANINALPDENSNSINYHKMDSLLNDLTKYLVQSETDSVNGLSKEEGHLVEHIKDSQKEVDIIERKLRDLDKALESLEQTDLEISENNSMNLLKDNNNIFSSKETNTQISKRDTKTGNDFEGEHSIPQFKFDEILDFPNENSQLGYGYTCFSRTRTDSVQPDVTHKLSQGDDSSSTREQLSSSGRAEGEESTDLEEHGYERKVADQHQLSEEMKELLKELEKESKQ